MLLASDLAVLDHRDGTVLLIANAINHNDLDTGVDEAYADAVARLDAMTADLARPAPASPVVLPPSELPEFTAPVGRPTLPGVGGGHQGAHPRRRSLPGRALAALRDALPAEALDVYRVLRATNPSPYMYLFRFDGFDVVGSSPEALVKVEDGHAMLHPIAGTRPRGADPAAGHRAGRGAARPTPRSGPST